MIDLHTHSVFSDGELIPAELTRRLEVLGYEAVAITDHADPSNLEIIVPHIREAAEQLNRYRRLQCVVGVELTHLPPELIAPLAKEARRLGAQIVVVHGETLVEPVPPGTNRAAVSSKQVDVLAHPGLISREEVELAKKNGVGLEITSRKGHCLGNGHVARLALEVGAPLVLNSDAHAPSDLIGPELARQVGLGAGLELAQVNDMLANARGLLARRGVKLLAP